MSETENKIVIKDTNISQLITSLWRVALVVICASSDITTKIPMENTPDLAISATAPVPAASPLNIINNIGSVNSAATIAVHGLFTALITIVTIIAHIVRTTICGNISYIL